MTRVLKLGSFSLQTLAALDINQSYEPLGGEFIPRTINGTGLKQMTWQRTRIVTSGQGWIPDGLDSIDTSAQLVLACIKPRAVRAVLATRQATLPAARRSDAGHTPWGVATLSDGRTVRTTATIVGNVATLAAVAGVVAYDALYLPQFTVWAMRPTDALTRGDGIYRWDLVCEEV